MNGYHEIILDNSKTLPYLHKCLSYGHTLSKVILDNIDIDSGLISTSLPYDTNEENIYNFKYGGIVPEKSPQTDSQNANTKEENQTSWVPIRSITQPVVDIIRDFVNRDAERICIFEDALAKSTDSKMDEYKSLIRTYQHEVYHLVNIERADDQSIRETIDWAYSFWPPMIRILTSLPEKIHNKLIELELTLDLLELVGQRVEMVIVSAYDGEGYLIWRKTS